MTPALMTKQFPLNRIKDVRCPQRITKKKGHCYCIHKEFSVF